MEKKQEKSVLCQICKEKKKLTEVTPAQLVRKPIVEVILKKHPDWSSEGYICNTDLNNFREEYITNILETEKGELSFLEKEVMKSLKEQELLSKNVNIEFERQLTVGERISDRLTTFAGSWKFISIFMVIVFIWMGVNSIVLILKPFDPYPFILLNLVLSCLAAIQAPVILMSQNRQASRDRLQAEYDYRVNLKAELEVRQLHEKMDHLLMYQWQRLLEIQEIQMDMLEEIAHKAQ
ncbi:MAG: DUF1003 domain-containing protein [Anaerolineales bacterium]